MNGRKLKGSAAPAVDVTTNLGEQEHGETSLTDDRNCKGQPIALTQPGHYGPTCIFIITSRDLPEMKEEPFTVLSN